MKEKKLILKDIKKTFNENGKPLKVLNSITLEVMDNEFISILGPSGCGKTTLFHIISGITRLDSGEIIIDGKTIQDPRGYTAYMPQKDLLFPWRTVLQNITIGMELDGVDRKTATTEAQELLDKFGLSGFETSFPAVLSGGMRQRVAVARTILFKREILLLDEPLGSLDAMTRKRMQKWLLGVCKEFKKTVLLVTHDIEEAIFLSDRIYITTKRPASIKKILEIDLPHPRDITSTKFVRYKKEILTILKEETN